MEKSFPKAESNKKHAGGAPPAHVTHGSVRVKDGSSISSVCQLSYSAAMDIVVAVTRFTLIGAALLVTYLGYREYTTAREAEEQRQRYHSSAACAQNSRARRRAPPQPSENCPICLDSFYSPIEILPCGHLFHRKCLKNWFQQRLVCPVCKDTLSPEDKQEYGRRLRD